tara:strand:- start:1138 stop:1341 length:204 start_codon:yes stop_codon:yes gene_type:complete
MSNVTYPDVTVQLSGTDGNAFAIIGKVSKAIRSEVGAEEAKKFSSEVLNSESYDDLLQFCMRTVNVT